MIVLGVVLLVIGVLAHSGIIWTLGILAIVIGAIFAMLSMAGRPFAGRRYWW